MCPLLDCSKLPVNWKNSNGVTIFWHDTIVNFFWRCFVSLAKFRYWSKFHVNINPGFAVMTVYLNKGLIRNLEIGYTPVLVFDKLEKVNLAQTFLLKCYSMLRNARRVTTCYRFWVIKGKPVGGEGWVKLPPATPRLELITGPKGSLIKGPKRTVLGCASFR